nr:uncharacterized protein LOC115264764 [Aedes albopictus]XP_029724649.1 uncharacterized protein LOC109424355 [Aedes albopictus]
MSYRIRCDTIISLATLYTAFVVIEISFAIKLPYCFYPSHRSCCFGCFSTFGELRYHRVWVLRPRPSGGVVKNLRRNGGKVIDEGIGSRFTSKSVESDERYPGAREKSLVVDSTSRNSVDRRNYLSNLNKCRQRDANMPGSSFTDTAATATEPEVLSLQRRISTIEDFRIMLQIEKALAAGPARLPVPGCTEL